MKQSLVLNKKLGRGIGMKTVLIIFVFLCSPLFYVFAQQSTEPTLILIEPAFQVPLNRLPLFTFDSPNRNFTAIVCPDDKNTFIYRVNWQGNMGMREKVPKWKAPDCFKKMWISNDGQSIAGTEFEDGILPSDAAEDTTILSFYRNGQLLNQVRLGQMLGDTSVLPQTTSGLRLTNDIYLNDSGKLIVEIADGRNLLFEMSNGKIVPLEFSEPVEAKWKVFQDIRRGYEFQYPDDYLITPPEIKNPLISDFLLKKEKTGWLFNIFVEEARDSEERRSLTGKPFEDFAVERTKLRYQADGPDSSQYVIDTVKKQTFKTQNNLDAVEFYLTVANEIYFEDSDESITEKRIEGPIYAVSIASPKESPKSLVLRLTDEGLKSKSELDILRKIVDTVKALK